MNEEHGSHSHSLCSKPSQRPCDEPEVPQSSPPYGQRTCHHLEGNWFPAIGNGLMELGPIRGPIMHGEQECVEWCATWLNRWMKMCLNRMYEVFCHPSSAPARRGYGGATSVSGPIRSCSSADCCSRPRRGALLRLRSGCGVQENCGRRNLVVNFVAPVKLRVPRVLSLVWDLGMVFKSSVCWRV